MSKNIKTTTQRVDLLSDKNYLSFIKIQADYNIAQTGGSALYTNEIAHQERLVSDVNLLSSIETKRVVYSILLGNN